MHDRSIKTKKRKKVFFFCKFTFKVARIEQIISYVDGIQGQTVGGGGHSGQREKKPGSVHMCVLQQYIFLFSKKHKIAIYEKIFCQYPQVFCVHLYIYVTSFSNISYCINCEWLSSIMNRNLPFCCKNKHYKR